jgi:hypothetical protein
MCGNGGKVCCECREVCGNGGSRKVRCECREVCGSGNGSKGNGHEVCGGCH